MVQLVLRMQVYFNKDSEDGAAGGGGIFMTAGLLNVRILLQSHIF